MIKLLLTGVFTTVLFIHFLLLFHRGPWFKKKVLFRPAFPLLQAQTSKARICYSSRNKCK
ncbi:MAG: light-harvesting protein [Chloroflexi bacterium]|nr:MAG: light-harvesting protein [Chloroflexota bacterium]